MRNIINCLSICFFSFLFSDVCLSHPDETISQQLSAPEQINRIYALDLDKTLSKGTYKEDRDSRTACFDTFILNFLMENIQADQAHGLSPAIVVVTMSNKENRIKDLPTEIREQTGLEEVPIKVMYRGEQNRGYRWLLETEIPKKQKALMLNHALERFAQKDPGELYPVSFKRLKLMDGRDLPVAPLAEEIGKFELQEPEIEEHDQPGGQAFETLEAVWSLLVTFMDDYQGWAKGALGYGKQRAIKSNISINGYFSEEMRGFDELNDLGIHYSRQHLVYPETATNNMHSSDCGLDLDEYVNRMTEIELLELALERQRNLLQNRRTSPF